jgi:hypothetical protein
MLTYYLGIYKYVFTYYLFTISSSYNLFIT